MKLIKKNRLNWGSKTHLGSFDQNDPNDSLVFQYNVSRQKFDNYWSKSNFEKGGSRTRLFQVENPFCGTNFKATIQNLWFIGYES